MSALTWDTIGLAGNMSGLPRDTIGLGGDMSGLVWVTSSLGGDMSGLARDMVTAIINSLFHYKIKAAG